MLQDTTLTLGHTPISTNENVATIYAKTCAQEFLSFQYFPSDGCVPYPTTVTAWPTPTSQSVKTPPLYWLQCPDPPTATDTGCVATADIMSSNDPTVTSL